MDEDSKEQWANPGSHSLGLNTGLSHSNLNKFASPVSSCLALPSVQCLGSAPMELFLPHSPPHPPSRLRELAPGCPLVPIFSGLPMRTASLSKLQALEGRACVSCFSFICRVHNSTSRALKTWCRTDWGLDPLTHLISSHLGNILNLKLYFIIQVTDKNIHSNPQSLFITHQESSSTCTGRKNKKRKEKKVEKRDGGSRG